MLIPMQTKKTELYILSQTLSSIEYKNEQYPHLKSINYIGVQY